VGDSFYQKNSGFIFGIPNARMSSYPYFPHFYSPASLDKFVSGIPNAITTSSATGHCRKECGCTVAIISTGIASAQAVVLKPRAADQLKIDVKGGS
jgi:hypothetical protein